MKNKKFEELVNEALEQSFSGWDFAFLENRIEEEAIPWDYLEIVHKMLKDAKNLLDMGTGGGEKLASISPLPPKSFATEAYLPNVPIAAGRLNPLGVPVLAVEDEEKRLPFKDNSFELVLNRHESYHPAELKRIIKPGGRFITQQVGGKDNIQLNEFLQEEVHLEYASWDMAFAVQALEEQGFVILQKKEAFPKFVFLDIGAVVFYLKVIEWQIKGFSVELYKEKLKTLHEKILENNGFECFSHRFLIEAIKPEK